jgi:hypothetical protein
MLRPPSTLPPAIAREAPAHRRRHRQAAGEDRQPIEVPAACSVRDHAWQALSVENWPWIRFSMAGAEALPMLDLEPEENWLRHRLRRLRTILRYANEPRVESGLRELIADAEERLDLLERQKVPQSK